MAYTLVLRKVHEDSAMAIGRVITLQPGDVVGRGAEASVRLDDTSVSRRHLTVAGGDPLVLENVSERNGVYLDGVSIAPGNRASMSTRNERLQIGGLLFVVQGDDPTRPVREQLTLSDTAAPAQAPLVISTDGDACTVHLEGKLLDMSAATARALRALARCPGEVVHTWDIQNEVGARHNVAQLMSGIRRALRAAIGAKILSEDVLRGWLTQCGTNPSDAARLSGATLIRRVVWARRGHGYVLMAPSDIVRLDVV